MVIRASAATEVRALIGALGGEDAVAREAAIARLSVIGPRAIDKLTTAFNDTNSRRTRLAILQTFEAIADHRTGPLARHALVEGGDTAVAAIGVLRVLLVSDRDETASEALDALVATALDPSNDHRLRIAAFEALQDAPGGVGARLTEPFRAELAALQAGAPSQSADLDVVRGDAVWRDAEEGHLPEDPRMLREALASRASSAPLNTLRKMIDAVRAREAATEPGGPVNKDAWRALRGSLHQALALRGSSVALYDLRESLTDGTAMPLSLLGALHVIGDESCLEGIAALWEADGGDEHRRYQLESAFRAIAKRERIGPGHKIVKRLKARGSGLV